MERQAMDTPAFETLITGLQNKSAYDHPVDEITLRETHISWVLLTGTYVYKIKKPVDFGFLDFSTLEKRKHFCEEEVRLNSRLAPDLYLGVVPICGDVTTPHINGPGTILEYAVKMRQFDTSQEFDVLLAGNKLGKDHMDETARVIADFHARAAVADKQSPFGNPEAVFQPVEENFDQIKLLGKDWLTRHQLVKPLELLQQWALEQSQKLRSIFQKRKENGFIRECHGDLHLRNIVVHNQRVMPFDGIEFNDNLRWVDVISELAFLLMDLDDHNHYDLSRRLLNRYLQLSGDYEGLNILRFYQMYRAMVRAKVAGLQQLQKSNEDGSLSLEIENYLKLALKYTQSVTPKLIITVGRSGSGKTYVSQKLLEQYSIIRIRSDVERKRLFGMTETTRNNSGIDKGIYNKDATLKTYQHLLELSDTIVNAGFSVIVDAAFLKQNLRRLFYDFAEKKNIPFRILFCDTSEEIQRQRLVERQQLNKDASDADLTILEQQLLHYEPLTGDENDVTITIDTSREPDISDAVKWLNANPI